MNTALTILFLLLPAFPDFTGAWQAESPVSPIVSDPPDSTSRYMSDTELQKQVALLKTISDPVTRSRIVTDIGNSYNKNVFTVLDAYLAEEEDPSVRADIISTLANLPVRKKQPEDLPSIRIDWKSVDPAQYENSAKSSCLPEKMAAKRFLSGKKFLVHTEIRLPDEFTAMQQKYFKLRNAGTAESIKQLEQVIDTHELPLIRLEAIRSLSAQKKLSSTAVKKLQKIITEDYVRIQFGVGESKRQFDHDSVRSAAYMALLEHAREPEAARALKAIEPKLNKILAKGKNPLLQEYVRQIRLAVKGKKVVPAPLPQRGSNRTFRFKE